MATVTYRVDDETKEKLDKLSEQHDNKNEFMTRMIHAYQNAQATENEEIDFSKFQHVENQVLSSVRDSYFSILYSVQNSVMELRKEKKEILSIEKNLKDLIAQKDALIAQKDEEISGLQKKLDTLLNKLENTEKNSAVQIEKLKKEIEFLEANSENVKTYIIENQKLREEIEKIKGLEKEIIVLQTKLEVYEKMLEKKE